MQQRLIVEGNDAIAISEILIKRKITPPKGYSDKEKFKREFVISTGSIDKVNFALEKEIDSPAVERIGIIVDANEVGIVGRLEMIGNLLENNNLQKTDSNWPTWKNDNDESPLLVSLWVMPDNKANGYLEHFLYNLIPNDYKIARDFASKNIDEYYEQNPKIIKEVRKQKAKTHAYLSLMENPGLPFGTAVQAGYFDHTHEMATELEGWFKHTFLLED